MHVTRLVLDHFRSWTHCLIDFEPGVTVLYGRNGLGKTNIVEAIEFLSTGASHRASASAPLVERGQRTATIRANVASGGGDGADVADADGDDGAANAEGDGTNHDSAADVTTYTVTIPLRGGNRARINSEASVYLRDIVGRVRTVTFAPDDQLLVSMDPARRRGFLDSAGAQLVSGYYEALQGFTHVARQRAQIFRQIAQDRAVGRDISPLLAGLDAWTGGFMDAGIRLTRMRARVCAALQGEFASIYADLADDGSRATMRYTPNFTEALPLLAVDGTAQALGSDDADDAPDDAPDEAAAMDAVRRGISGHFQRIYEGEVAQGRNLIGPHRDDIVFELDGAPARDYASNGEMWTIALALRMALFRVLDRMPGGSPILILDDVFSQLDATRRARIVDFAASCDQTIITVAAPGDVPEGIDARLVDVAAVKEESDASPW
ncbi:recombination protein RecF [Pseudoscardovia radai]|uniref:DNA replication and repair protein RecF n=1 Tax=Pseudoscardovia radai TaxID=987066 RepID=A0A261EUK9_9BIFI|nr:AAA family ATPase [Pseudoscardovia radai]OZG50543.1 recombination protein RecF [Pseudoscardovia radai]